MKLNFDINLNGNDFDDMADTMYNLREALNKAQAALGATRPHGRNYPGGYKTMVEDNATFDEATIHLHQLHTYCNAIELRLCHEQNRLNGVTA